MMEEVRYSFCEHIYCSYFCRRDLLQRESCRRDLLPRKNNDRGQWNRTFEPQGGKFQAVFVNVNKDYHILAAKIQNHGKLGLINNSGGRLTNLRSLSEDRKPIKK